MGQAWGPRAAGREEVLGTQTKPERLSQSPRQVRPAGSRERERLPLPWQEALGREPGSFWNNGASRGQAVGWVAGKMSGSCGEGLPVKAGGGAGRVPRRKGLGFRDAKSGSPWHPGGPPCLWSETWELAVRCSLGVWGLEGLQDTHRHTHP